MVIGSTNSWSRATDVCFSKYQGALYKYGKKTWNMDFVPLIWPPEVVLVIIVGKDEVGYLKCENVCFLDIVVPVL